MAVLSQNELKRAKSEAKKRFGSISGIMGFGIGEETIIFYLKEAAVKESASLPSHVEGIPVEYVVSGNIKPLAESA